MVCNICGTHGHIGWCFMFANSFFTFSSSLKYFLLPTRMIGASEQMKCPTSGVCDVLDTVRTISGEAHQSYISVGIAKRS